MSLYLPPELSWLGWIAGGAWPEGDEDKVWAVSDAYKHAGAALRKLTPEIADVKRVSVSAYPEGAGGDKIGTMFDQLLTGGQSMDSLAHFMDQMFDATEDFGTSVQAAKLMTIVSLAALAIEIAWAWAFPPTAPAQQAAEEAATQIVVRRLELQIQERIVAKVLSVFGEKFANLSKGWVMKILEGALISGGLDAVVQVSQMGPGGHRKNFNWKEFGTSVAAGGLGAPFGGAAGNWINKYTTKFFGNKLANPWVRFGNGAIVGMGSSPVFGLFGGIGAGVVSGDWSETLGNPHAWVGGLAHGGLVGGAKGYFGHNKFGNKSFEVEWKLSGDASVRNPGRDGFSFDPGGAESHGSRNGFDGKGFGGEHATSQDRPVGSNGSNGSRGGDRDVFDGSHSSGDRSGSSEGGQSPRATHPASSNGGRTPEEPVTQGNSRFGHGSAGGSDSGNPNTRPQVSPATEHSRTGNGSDASSNSGRYEPVSNSGSHSSNASSNGSSGSSNGSAAAGGRTESPASASHSGNNGSSSGANPSSSPKAPSSNLSENGRGSSVTGGGSDRPAGGPPGTRPFPGSDGSVSQPPKSGLESPSRQVPDSNIVAGQSQRPSTPVSATGSAGSQLPPGRSGSVSSLSSSESPPPSRSGSVSSLGSNDSQPLPSRPVSPLGSNDSQPPPGRSGPGSSSSSELESPQRRPVRLTPDGPPQVSRPSGSGAGSGDQPPPRHTPVPDSGGSSPARQRPPESDAVPPRGSVAPDRPSGPDGKRGHDGAEPGVQTFGGDQEHPNWSRSESGDVVVTSPDGTQHRVDEHGNIFFGRPEDSAWVKVGPDRSVEFVPKSGNEPGAAPNSRADAPSRPGRDGEFGFGRNDGTEHTVLDDGSVRTKSPDGSTTIVKGSGAAELRSPWNDRTVFEPDGTATHTRFEDSATITTHDDTEHIVTIGRERDADGNLVVTSPDGTRHVVGGDRTILVGRPDDPQLMKIDADHAIVFVGPDGSGPAATPGKGTGVQSPTFTRPDGVSHAVLGDGSVRTKSRDDWTLTVRPDGATEFASPTRDTTVHKADRTVIESGPGKPTVITGPDQTRQTVEPNRAVTVEHPDSTKHVVFDAADLRGGGRTEHPDHTVIHHDLSDGPRKPGVVQMDRPDGIGFESSPKGIKVFEDGTTYERGSGQSVRVTAPNGHTESRPMNEPIALSNGAQLETTPKGFRVVHGDESVSEIGPHGARFTDGDGVVRGTRTDGTAFVGNLEGGPVREVRGDGAVRVTAEDETAWGSRGDGTTWKVDENNKVHISAPDGTVAPPVDPRSPYVAGDQLTAKIKPHLPKRDDGPLGGYQAPIAPIADDWIPPGYDVQNASKRIAPEGYWDPRYGSGSPHADYWPPPDHHDFYDEGPPNPGPDDDDRSSGGWHVGGPGHGGNSNSSGAGGRPGDSGEGDNSGGPGSGQRFGDRGLGSNPNGSGGTGESGGHAGGHDSPGNDRQQPPPAHRPPPPRPDPAMLARMLQNLHAAENLEPPPYADDSFRSPGEGGAGERHEGEPSPDFWNLGGGLPTPLGGPGSVGANPPGGPNDTGGSDLDARRGDRLGRAGQNSLDQPTALNIRDLLKPPRSPLAPSDLGSPDRPGAAEDSAASGASRDSDGHRPPVRPGVSNTAGDENDSSSLTDPSGAKNHSGAPGSERTPDGTGVGSDSGVHGSADASDGTGVGGDSDAPGSEHAPDGTGAGSDSGVAGSGDQQSAPGSGSHPADPLHAGTPGQQENSGPNAHASPSTPGRAPTMPDGHAPAAPPTAPAAAPPGAAQPGAAPGNTAGPPKKQSPRNRKKDDKPRKKPRSVLMPSPDEESEQRAGTSDSTDVGFLLGASISATEPVVEKRPTTKTMRSNADG
ncbi:hypothetical protein [Nocardia sp. NPDC050175]|uniref:WXG100-like domain-containing protein n=1 Tax=Nocardia sp. NPDC050175 TaxID=3364317 RepID=UPI0037B090F9